MRERRRHAEPEHHPARQRHPHRLRGRLPRVRQRCVRPPDLRLYLVRCSKVGYLEHHGRWRDAHAAAVFEHLQRRRSHVHAHHRPFLGLRPAARLYLRRVRAPAPRQQPAQRDAHVRHGRVCHHYAGGHPQRSGGVQQLRRLLLPLGLPVLPVGPHRRGHVAGGRAGAVHRRLQLRRSRSPALLFDLGEPGRRRGQRRAVQHLLRLRRPRQPPHAAPQRSDGQLRHRGPGLHLRHPRRDRLPVRPFRARPPQHLRQHRRPPRQRRRRRLHVLPRRRHPLRPFASDDVDLHPLRHAHRGALLGHAARALRVLLPGGPAGGALDQERDLDRLPRLRRRALHQRCPHARAPRRRVRRLRRRGGGRGAVLERVRAQGPPRHAAGVPPGRQPGRGLRLRHGGRRAASLLPLRRGDDGAVVPTFP